MHDLGESENTPQFVSRGRNADRQQCVASFGGSHEVADRADAADARHESRHLGEGPTLAKLLKPAKLRHVKAGVFDAAMIVEMQGNLRVPFDPGYRIDQNRFLRSV